jgi:hypothetical protein
MSHGLNTNPFVPQIVNGKEETLVFVLYYNFALTNFYGVGTALQQREDIYEHTKLQCCSLSENYAIVIILHGLREWTLVFPQFIF